MPLSHQEESISSMEPTNGALASDTTKLAEGSEAEGSPVNTNNAAPAQA